MSVLKPGTTATLSGFTTLSDRFRQQCHVNFRMSSQGSQSIAHAALHSALHRQISCLAVATVLEAAAGSHFQHQQSTSYSHTDLYYASLNVLLPRSLSFLLLFLLVEAHVGLWAPCRQQWLVELVQVSCVTLVHRLWLDGWQEVIRVMWSHCIRKEGRKAGCHRAKCMSMVTISQARRVPIVAVLTIRNQVAHQGLQGHVALQTKMSFVNPTRMSRTKWRSWSKMQQSTVCTEKQLLDFGHFRPGKKIASLKLRSSSKVQQSSWFVNGAVTLM